MSAAAAPAEAGDDADAADCALRGHRFRPPDRATCVRCGFVDEAPPPLRGAAGAAGDRQGG